MRTAEPAAAIRAASASTTRSTGVAVGAVGVGPEGRPGGSGRLRPQQKARLERAVQDRATALGLGEIQAGRAREEPGGGENRRAAEANGHNHAGRSAAGPARRFPAASFWGVPVSALYWCDGKRNLAEVIRLTELEMGPQQFDFVGYFKFLESTVMWNSCDDVLPWGLRVLTRAAQLFAAVWRPVLDKRGHAQLAGVIDIHVHSDPDSVPRSIDAFDLARLAKERGMRALVLKNHYEPTASLAWSVRKFVPGIEVFGGIDLNRSVGGVNPAAMERMVLMKGGYGRVVWMPTFDAENQVRFSKENAAVRFRSRRTARCCRRCREVIALAREARLALETGHSSAAEGLLIMREGKRAGRGAHGGDACDASRRSACRWRR